MKDVNFILRRYPSRNHFRIDAAVISNTSSRSRNQRGARQEQRKERETSSAAACEFIFSDV
jgi:hypothetical protein